MPKLTLALRNDYTSLYNTLMINPAKLAEVSGIVKRIADNRARYELVAAQTQVPWYFIALIHNMECSGNFKQHLHNGDPLTAKTVQVPAGRPRAGVPPFTWEESAMDALDYEGFLNNSGWGISAMLWRLEKYNGFGNRSKGINTPYLWSYCQHYTKGKYVADRVFDPEAVSKQVGAAVILKLLVVKLNLKFEAEPEKAFPDLFTVNRDPKTVNPVAIRLQRFLNRFGYSLNPDGKAGDLTSDAVFEFTGKYMPGDVRRT